MVSSFIGYGDLTSTVQQITSVPIWLLITLMLAAMLSLQSWGLIPDAVPTLRTRGSRRWSTLSVSFFHRTPIEAAHNNITGLF